MFYLILLIFGFNIFDWSFKIVIIMIICNIVVIVFVKFIVKYFSVGLVMFGFNFFGGFGVVGVLVIISFGYILGVGVIFGLVNLGSF